MLLTVRRNDIENTWVVQRDDQHIPVSFRDGRDVAAAALLMGAMVRTDDPAVQEACRQLSVMIEGDPTLDYDQLGT